jgi:hypothetical protein
MVPAANATTGLLFPKAKEDDEVAPIKGELGIK